jgi:hypothetical protein
MDALEKAKAEEKERRERQEHRAEAERAKKRAAAAARLAAKAKQQQAASVVKGSPAAMKGSTVVARGLGRCKKDGAAAAAMSMTDINDAVLEVMSSTFFFPPEKFVARVAFVALTRTLAGVCRRADAHIRGSQSFLVLREGEIRL